MVQDHLGFMWIGTRNGLCRYNGYDFKNFSHDPGDSATLNHNYIGALMIDHKGYVWVAVSGGLHRINPISLEVISLPYHRPSPKPGERPNNVTWMYRDQQDTLWLGTNQGLQKITHYDPDHPEEMTYELYTHLPGYQDYSLIDVLKILEHSDGSWWIAGIQGLIHWDKKTEKASKRLPEIKIPGTLCLCVKDIYDLAEDALGHVWAASVNGFIRIKKTSDSTFHQEMMINTWIGNGQPNTNTFLSVASDTEGNIWTGSYSSGLFYVDAQTGNYQQIKGTAGEPHALADNHISVLYFDQAKNLWLGANGLYMLPGHKKNFHHTSFDPKQANILKSTEVYGFEEDAIGNLWVAHKDGLSRISSDGRSVDYFDQASGMDFLHVIGMEAGENGDMWFQAKGALMKYEASSQAFTSFQANGFRNDTVNTIIPLDLMKDKAGNLWIPGYMGVLKFDPETEEFQSYVRAKGNFVTNIQQDEQGNLWTGDGVSFCHFDPTKATSFHPFNPDTQEWPKLRNVNIRDIHMASDGICWVGTVAGLFRVDLEQKKTAVFTEKDGLPANYIRSIEEDDQGRLWLASDGGLSRFDPETKHFKNFIYDEYFDFWFYSRVSYRAQDGTLLFGGSNGYIRFHPDSISDNPFLPPVYLIDFQIGFENVPVGAPDPTITVHDYFLEKPLLETNNLNLSFKERTLTFRFAALNFSHSDENQFAYKMEGFDEKWNHTDAFHRIATYTNLDPGDYTFHVKASNNDGIWNEKGTSIQLSISPPWWKTWWAYALYFMGLSGIAFLIAVLRIRNITKEFQTKARIERAKAEERENVRKRSSRDFHDEAGNKLTKLSLYTELTKRKAANDPEVMDYLGHIERNVKDLATGMRDFIWVLDPEKDSLIETLGRIREFGSSLFEHSETTFSHQIDEQALAPFNLSIKAKRHLLLIFKEAMNNSLKYSQAPHAYFKAIRKGDELIISYRDDGKGV